MGFGRTALGRIFVYHAGTAVDSVGDTCGSRGGMVSWPRSWHTPCRAWYWCQATRSLGSTRIVRGMWSHRRSANCIRYITPAFSGSPWWGEINLVRSGCGGNEQKMEEIW